MVGRHYSPRYNRIQITDNIFIKTEHDGRMALSIEDEKFVELMDNDNDFKNNADDYWEAPLPFLNQRPPLPNNKLQAINRAQALDRSLRRNPTKKGHVSTIMDKLFEKRYAEEAPPLPDNKERWYLPMFGVYHPQKKDSIRMVFDSSAKFNNVSLNDVLLKGPDITNNLQGMLRLRREEIAAIGDVEQMFHNFKVKIHHLLAFREQLKPAFKGV